MSPEIIIIGGGPAGIAAAIQLRRYSINPILFEKDELGGLLKNASKVDNYPGFPQGISGQELVKLLKIHLDSYNVTTKYERVKQLEFIGRGNRNQFLLSTSKFSYYSDIVVVASGTKPRKNEILESLSRELKENIFYEIYPVINKKGKRILIVGAGDAAFDYALNLAKSNEIIVLNRKKRVKALPLLKNRVRRAERISYVYNSVIERVGRGKDRKLLITYKNCGSPKSIETDYLICAIGREPQKDFFTKKLWEIEEELITNELLHLIGDVKNGNFRQVAIAIGNGVESAMRIYEKHGVIK